MIFNYKEAIYNYSRQIIMQKLYYRYPEIDANLINADKAR